MAEQELRTQVLFEVGVDGGVGGGPPEFTKVLALGQRTTRVVHKTARNAKVNNAPVAACGACGRALGLRKVGWLDVPVDVPCLMHTLQRSQRFQSCHHNPAKT